MSNNKITISKLENDIMRKIKLATSEITIAAGKAKKEIQNNIIDRYIKTQGKLSVSESRTLTLLKLLMSANDMVVKNKMIKIGKQVASIPTIITLMFGNIKKLDAATATRKKSGDKKTYNYWRIQQYGTKATSWMIRPVDHKLLYYYSVKYGKHVMSEGVLHPKIEGRFFYKDKNDAIHKEDIDAVSKALASIKL